MDNIQSNVKDYIKKQTLNIAFNGKDKVLYIITNKNSESNYLSFDNVYKLYNDFKKLGRQLFLIQDGDINRIEIHDNKIFVSWPLTRSLTQLEQENSYISNFLTSKYSFDNEDLGLNLISLSDIVNFSELIYLCSDSIKSFAKAMNNYGENGIITAENKFKRIINIAQNETEQAFQNSDLSKIPSIIKHIESKYPNLSKIVEELLYNDEFETIMPWLKYTNILSIFFHFFKLEIVYYSHIIETEAKKPKLCPNCNKYVTGKCTCMTVSESYRRNINKKNERLRNKLRLYLNTYIDIVPIDLRMRAEKMIEQADDNVKHWEDYPELKYLCDNIKTIIKEASKY